MKRPSGSAKDVSLARKRALIRSLIEQTTLSQTLHGATPMSATSAPAERLASIIQFPIQGK